MSDNIGGISACWYILAEDIENCAVLSNEIIVEPIEGKEWIKIPSTQNRNDVRITSENDRLGTYNVSISVSVPSPKLALIDTTQINNKNILFKFRTGNGKIFVIGSTDNFLFANVRSLTPSDVSGCSGVQINASGTLPHPELPSI